MSHSKGFPLSANQADNEPVPNPDSRMVAIV